MSDPDLATLLEQEQRLVFTSFDETTAWTLGSAMRGAAEEAGLPVALSITRGDRRLFHVALPGSSADNDGWLARKSAVVDRYGHSSYFVGCQFRARGQDFDVHSRLSTERFAAHGGAFPLTVRGAGCVGAIAVSGLPQIDDHAFVVSQLERFLTDDGHLG